MLRIFGCAYILILWGILSFYYSDAIPRTCRRCKKENDCLPPKCVCCNEEMPLSKEKVPQMVFFTFDDAVNTHIARFYRQLFHSNRRNPNGCPISMTLFISHANTVYSLVREFYQKGMEIASHSVTHAHMNASNFKREAKRQKENLARMARIPSSKIKGWRSPFLEPVGDAQPNMLQNTGYAYDATLTITKGVGDKRPPIPFTLDYGWPYDCKIKPCPKRNHKGFWEVPVVSLKDYLGKYECVYVDGCANPPPDEEAAFNFLWENFKAYYKTTKAPFGINMHAAWFYHGDRLKAMDRFIKELVKLDDVYIVSVKQVISWLKTPTPLPEIKSFKPWSCRGSNTSSSFQVRNKQIQKRLRELQQSNKENQQKDLARRHREWENKQKSKASKKLIEHENGNKGNRNVPEKYFRNIYPNGTTGQNPRVKKPGRSSSFTWKDLEQYHTNKSHFHKTSSNDLRRNKVDTTTSSTGEEQKQSKLQQNRAEMERRKLIQKEKIRKIKESQRIRQEQRKAAKQRKQLEIQRMALEKQRRLNKNSVLDKNQKNNIRMKNINSINSPMPLQTKNSLTKQYKAIGIGPKQQGNATENMPKTTKHKPIEKETKSQVPIPESLKENVTIIEKHVSRNSTNLNTNHVQERKDTLTSLNNNHTDNVRQLLQDKQSEALRPLQNEMAAERTEIQKMRIKKLREVIKQKLLKTKKLAIQKLKETKSITSMTRESRIKTFNMLIGKEIKELLQQEPWRTWILQYRQERKKFPEKRSQGIESSKQQNGTDLETFQRLKSKLNQHNIPPIIELSPMVESRRQTVNIKSPSSNTTLTSRIQQSPEAARQKMSYSKTDNYYNIISRQGGNNIAPLANKYTQNQMQKTNWPSSFDFTSSAIKTEAGRLSSNNDPTKGLRRNVDKPTQKIASFTTQSKITGLSKTLNETEPPIKTTLAGYFEKSVLKRRIQPKEVTIANPEIPKDICLQNVNCIAPECVCKTDTTPLDLPVKDLPQMIYFTIEGKINFVSYSKLKSLLTKSKKNPNNCRISGTFFASFRETSYRLANILQKDGMEISLHGDESADYSNSEQLKTDIENQRQKLIDFGRLPSRSIRGWKSPKLASSGDSQFEVLKRFSLYDSSLITNRSTSVDKKIWPFTLDYGWNEPCKNSDCPKKNHPGVWEVPITPVVFGRTTCNYADACDIQPRTEKETFDFLKDNFNSYYKTNKAPFGIHISQQWFYWYFNRNFSGLSKFLDYVLTLPDVYIVSVTNMIDWMKSPTTLDKIRDFKPWQC